ncbi:SDR family oxidoreductase [Herbaspirillum frisingense]|uniref:SDR family oxidoreductase n=1 Tax=Herbaspirillum frisingense TaxID=92645 RepID=UPI001601E4D8|nr:SDR family oxidoreductase [Herbaspirillum frisingense]QNB09454.1 SDR family oxidoreductase [Herbaspirillum frisingense]
MQIKDSVIFITGANGGLGTALIDCALERGAAKVYAGMRTIDAARPWPQQVTPVRLDVTNQGQVHTAAELAADVDILINNAGLNHCQALLAATNGEAARQEMEVNYFGTLAMCRAFAPLLAPRQGSIVNILSILARISLPMMGSLCASKAAGLRLTDALRAELAGQQVNVIGVLPGVIDTTMSSDFPPPKATPQAVAEAILDGILRDEEEIYPDGMSQAVARRLLQERDQVRTEFSAFL